MKITEVGQDRAELQHRLTMNRMKEASQAWEARVLRQLVEPALSSELKGTIREMAVTSFSEALAAAGGAGLAESIINSVSRSGSSVNLR